MKKRIICALATFLCILCLSGCEEESVTPNETMRVAVMADSAEGFAAESYCESTGSELIEYASSSDAVTAVQNGKADYVVLNEYDAQDFIDAGCEIEFFAKCDYQLDCRAFFTKENNRLCEEFNEAFDDLRKNGTLEKVKNANMKGEVYSTPESSGEKGELIMVCDPIFENRVYYNDENELKGTDVDIAKTVCAHLGYTLIIKVADFDEMFIELECGNADFIMSSAEYTQERAEDFVISDIYSTLEYNVYKKQ